MSSVWLAPVVNSSPIFLAPFVRMLTSASSTLSQGAPSFSQLLGLSKFYGTETIEIADVV